MLDLVEFPAEGREQADEALRDSYARIEAVVRELEATGAISTADGAPEVAATTGAAGTAGTTDAAGAPEPAASGFDPLKELPRFLGLTSEDVAGLEDEAGLAAGAGASHAFASMAVMMLLFSVVAAGGTLLQERAEGTLARLQLTPAAGRAVLLGKLLSVGAIAASQLVLLFAYGGAVFHVPVLANPLALVTVSLAWTFLAVGIGIAFAVLCTSQKQLEGLSTLVILVMSAVGGAWFPREVAPDWFRTVGGVTPVAFAMDAYHGVLWYGKGLLATDELRGVLPEVTRMLVLGAVLLAVAVRGYQRRFGSGA